MNRGSLLAMAILVCAGCTRLGYGVRAQDSGISHDAAFDLGPRDRGVDAGDLVADLAGDLAGDGPRDLAPDAAPLPLFSNGVQAAWVADAPGSWHAGSDVLIDTDAGMIGGLAAGALTFRVVTQSPAAVELGVFVFDQVTVDQDVIVRVTGSRALGIVARTIEIAGLLDLRGNTPEAGPGGFDGAAAHDEVGGPGGGGAGAPVGDTDDGGGGGGGFGSAGGRGGDGGTTPASGGNGGGVYGTAELTPLVGGSGGGVGAPARSGAVAPGGGGGGAAQLCALERIVISGGINAGGGGGGTGATDANDGAAGSGGGSGGAILLEAPDLSISGILAANGGGGGGSPKYEVAGLPGQPGQLSTDPAAGGLGEADQGTGGDGSALADPGAPGANGEANGGGGGGGAGRIRLNADGLVADGPISGSLSTGALPLAP